MNTNATFSSPNILNVLRKHFLGSHTERSPKPASRHPLCRWLRNVNHASVRVPSSSNSNLNNVWSVLLVMGNKLFCELVNDGCFFKKLRTDAPISSLEEKQRATFFAGAGADMWNNSNGLAVCHPFRGHQVSPSSFSLYSCNTVMHFTFPPMLRIISSAALSVNERPQQGAAKNLLFYSRRCRVAISAAHYSV